MIRAAGACLGATTLANGRGDGGHGCLGQVGPRGPDFRNLRHGAPDRQFFGCQHDHLAVVLAIKGFLALVGV